MATSSRRRGPSRAACRARRPVQRRTTPSAAGCGSLASSACAKSPSSTSQRFASGHALESRWPGTAAPAATDPPWPFSRTARACASDACRPSSEQLDRPARGCIRSRDPAARSRSCSVRPLVAWRAQSARSLRVTSGFSLQDPLQSRVHGWIRPALLEDAARVLDVPVVAIELQLDQSLRRELRAGRPAPICRLCG